MRKNQFYLVTCFVAVSFFALSSFVDSNAWGETATELTKEEKKEKDQKTEKCSDESTHDKWCILWQDLSFKMSWGYSDSTSNLETSGVPGTIIKDTETYSLGIGYFNKKILSQIFNHALKNNESPRHGFWWDFVIDPIEFNAGIKLSRAFTDTGLTVTRDLSDETSFNVGIAYNLPMENLYRNYFKK